MTAKKTLSVLLFLFIFTFGAGALNAAQSAAALKELAKESKLYNDPYWKILLHYEGSTSSIVSPQFFLSPKGRTNPAAEMDAAIDAIFSADAGENSASCRFPLRMSWLEEKLGLTPHKPACKALQDYLEYTDAQSLSVFDIPQNHFSLKNMFGQMGIKINRKGESAADGPCCYLTAQEKAVPPLDIYKGAAGKQHGSYALTSFEQIVKDFNVDKNRDIWEYRVNFSKEQVEKVVLHIWELKDAEAHNSFFTINGAAATERILMAGNPALVRSRTLRTHPINVAQNLRKQGIIENKAYHPSARAVSRAKTAQPPAKFIPLPGATLPIDAQSPLEAHAPSRFDVSVGRSDYRGHSFTKLRFSALSHDIMDSDTGVNSTVNMKFLSVEAKYYATQDNFDFKIDFIDIAALPIFSSFSDDKSLSSKLSFYADKENFAGTRSKGLAFNNTFGFTFAIIKGLDLSALIKADAEANNSPKGYYLGTGGVGRVVISPAERLKTSVQYSYDVGTNGHYSKSYYLEASQSVYLTKTLSLFGNYKYNFRDRAEVFDAGVSIYF